ncbi:MAG: Asp23/Gls24 family envelope stress response protein [Anaerolineae bacterium]
MEEPPTIGKITIAPSVLETIARMTALAVPGVVRLTPPIGIQRMLGIEDGVQILVQDGVVKVELFIVAGQKQNLLKLGRQIQAEVSRAIQDIVGMPVETVNVHIEDVCCGEKSRKEKRTA